MIFLLFCLTYFTPYDNLYLGPSMLMQMALFFLTAEYYSNVYMYHLFFIYSSKTLGRLERGLFRADTLTSVPFPLRSRDSVSWPEFEHHLPCH